MAAHEIEIEIAADGTINAKISGIKGPGCQVLARELAQLLGNEISFTPSAEFYENDVQADVDIEDQRRP